MAKQKTGAITISESIRLSLKDLQKDGLSRPGCICTATREWTAGGRKLAEMEVACCYLPGDESYIKLTYRVIDGEGKYDDYCYKIEIVEVPSNLGKGKVLYLICPVTRKKCRILYMAYGSRTFKSRGAYLNEGKRLYYDGQISSKLWRFTDAYFRTEDRIHKMRGFRFQYAGKDTRTHDRFKYLCYKMDLLDQERWTGRGVPKSLRGHIL